MSTAIEPGVSARAVSAPGNLPSDSVTNEDNSGIARFGRLRWWFDESPTALTASVAFALVLIGFLFILTIREARRAMPMLSISLQAVQSESVATDGDSGEQSAEFQQLSAAAASEPQEHTELPELPRAEVLVRDPVELLGNQADSDTPYRETEAALEQAGDMLRKMLQANQDRGRGTTATGGPGGRGAGQLDPESSAGRQARWIISYPTVPQPEYERMLDAFRIELAYLQSDRATMQYLVGLSGTGKSYTGPAEKEDRMFWYWMSQNRLRELDDSILRKHGLAPTSDVVHLYPKDLEKKLSDMEREYLKRQFKQANVEVVAQTNFKMLTGGPGGWHLEVTGMVLR